MEGGDAYSNKADQFMKEAQKVLKGINVWMQVHSSGILCQTKPSVQSRQFSCLSRQRPTTNWPSDGTMPREHTSTVSNAIKCARVDRLLTSIRKQLMLNKRSILQSASNSYKPQYNSISIQIEQATSLRPRKELQRYSKKMESTLLL